MLADQPDDAATKGKDVSSMPDLMMGNSQAEPEGPTESIFASRSGIRDPLRRIAQTLRAEHDYETSTAAAETAAPPLDAPESIESPAPERKARKMKGTPKGLKSKRHIERAKRRQKNYLQQRRDQKKMRVFYRRIKSILRFCFALIWCVLLWEIMHSPLWRFQTPRFQVEHNRLITHQQLLPLIRPWVGKPLYAIDPGKLAHQIESRFEIVDQAVVRRRLFPMRLEILVQEKTPWAETYTNEQQTHPYGLINQDGFLSLKGYSYQPALYNKQHLVKIMISPKTTLTLAYLHQLQQISWQANQIHGLHLVNVDIRNPRLIVLNFAEMPVILGTLNEQASARLARLLPLLPKINEFRDGIQSVDLRWNEQVTFHQKPNAKLALPKPPATQG